MSLSKRDEYAKMFKCLKSLFVKPKPVVEPAKGVIASEVSDLFTITIEHKGGDHYVINTVGNLTKQGISVYRNGKAKALNYFHATCSLYAVK